MSYVDGFVVPVPEGSKDEYRQLAEKMGRKCKDLGAVSYVEAWADDVQRGKVTDFYMAVKAEDGESVVFSYILWPSKDVRDKGWEKIMADPRDAVRIEPDAVRRQAHVLGRVPAHRRDWRDGCRLSGRSPSSNAEKRRSNDD